MSREILANLKTHYYSEALKELNYSSHVDVNKIYDSVLQAITSYTTYEVYKSKNLEKINFLLENVFSNYGIYPDLKNLGSFLSSYGSVDESVDSYSFFIFSDLVIKFTSYCSNKEFVGFETKNSNYEPSFTEFDFFCNSYKLLEEEMPFHVFVTLLLDCLEGIHRIVSPNTEQFCSLFGVSGISDVKPIEDTNSFTVVLETYSDNYDVLKNFIQVISDDYAFSRSSNTLLAKNDEHLFFKLYTKNLLSNTNEIVHFDTLFLFDKLGGLDDFFSAGFKETLVTVITDSDYVPEVTQTILKYSSETKLLNTDGTSKGILESIYPGINFSETDKKKIQEEVLLKRAKANVEEAYSKGNDVNNLVSSISSLSISEKFKTLEKAFKLTFLMTKNQKETLTDLEELYSKAKKENSKVNVLDTDVCNLVLATVYFLFAISKENKNYVSKMTTEVEIENLRKTLKGEIRQIPGFLETTQATNIGWNPQLKMLDGNFAKYYANLYNFVTGSANPYNQILNDAKYTSMQTMVLNGRTNFIKKMNEQNYLDKIDSYFYDPRSSNIDSTKKDMSIYNLIKNVGNLFAELENPIEFKVYSEGLSFSLDLSAMLTNTCLEMASAALLELYMYFFTKKVFRYSVLENGIKVKKELSIADIYFELNSLVKLLELCEQNGLSPQMLSEEIKNIKENKMAADPANKRSILYFLDSEGFFALNGLSSIGTSVSDELFSLFGIPKSGTASSTASLNAFLKKKAEENNATLTGTPFSYNLYSNNKKYWYLFNYIKNKTSHDDSECCNFYDPTKTSTTINNLTTAEKVFCFLLSLKDSQNSVLANNSFSDFIPLMVSFKKMLPTLPTALTNSNKDELSFDYYNLFKTNYSNTKNFPFFDLINNCATSPLFLTWEKAISANAVLFSKAALENRQALSNVFASNNVSPMLDTMARLLPTTMLLKIKFGLSFVPMLKQLVAWLDLSLEATVVALKEYVAQYKKDMRGAYELYEWQVLESRYANRIYAVNSMIDILVESIPSYSFCINNGSITTTQLGFDLFQRITTDISNASEDSKDSSFPSGNGGNVVKLNNPNVNSSDSDTNTSQKLLINALAGVLKNKTVTYISQAEDNSLDQNYLSVSTNSLEELPTVLINSDYDFIKAVELNKGNVKVSIPAGTVISDFADFIKPTKNVSELNAVSQIVNSFKLNSIKNQLDNFTGNNPEELNKLLVDVNIDSGINFSDSGYISSIDFSKTNSKQLFDAISNFNYTDFVNFKFTNHKILESFDETPKDGEK